MKADSFHSPHSSAPASPHDSPQANPQACQYAGRYASPRANQQGRRVVACALLVCGAAAVAGCATSGSPDWDARFGESNRALTAQQVLDPSAPTRNAQNSVRNDGRTTREAIDRQAETYRSPPPTNVINIGVGGGATR
jgi:hypothetical protein